MKRKPSNQECQRVEEAATFINSLNKLQKNYVFELMLKGKSCFDACPKKLNELKQRDF